MNQLPRPLVQGCTLPVLPAGHTMAQRAEILAIRFREREGDYTKADFYVHFVSWNKRLDQVVTFDKLRLEDIEWPKEKSSQPSADKSSHKKRSKDRQRNRTSGSRKTSLAIQAAANRAAGKGEGEGESVPATPSRTGDVTGEEEAMQVDGGEDDGGEASQQQEEDTQQQDEEMDDGEASRDGDENESVSAADGEGEREGSVVSKQTSAQAALAPGASVAGGESQDQDDEPPQPLGFNETTTFAEEMERLRHGGSVSNRFQAEAYRMKNINKIIMGQYEVDAWYFSPYPEEFVTLPCMYICEFCLEYFGEKRCFERHRKKCTISHPPGNEIYYDGRSLNYGGRV